MPSKLASLVTLPTRLFQGDLTPADIRLYIALLQLQKDGVVENIHLETLGDRVGVTQFTVVASLRRLVAAGFITKKRMSRLPSLLTITAEGEVVRV